MTSKSISFDLSPKTPSTSKDKDNLPTGKPIRSSLRASTKRTTPTRSSSLASSIFPSPSLHFHPHRGDPKNPLDRYADALLTSPHFEFICAQALQLASVLPQTPPPLPFTSFDETPMHQWYESFLTDFITSFSRKLLWQQRYPQNAVLHTNGTVSHEADTAAFNREANLHINSILRCFHASVAAGYLGCCASNLLFVDATQPNALLAATALHQITQPAEHPPKADWQVGQPLQAEYRRRLRMFRAGVLRLLQESEAHRWILDLPTQLERGVAAYEEFYIAHLRHDILAVRGQLQGGSGDGGGIHNEN